MAAQGLLNGAKPSSDVLPLAVPASKRRSPGRPSSDVSRLLAAAIRAGALSFVVPGRQCGDDEVASHARGAAALRAVSSVFREHVDRSGVLDRAHEMREKWQKYVEYKRAIDAPSEWYTDEELVAPHRGKPWWPVCLQFYDAVCSGLHLPFTNSTFNPVIGEFHARRTAIIEDVKCMLRMFPEIVMCRIFEARCRYKLTPLWAVCQTMPKDVLRLYLETHVAVAKQQGMEASDRTQLLSLELNHRTVSVHDDIGNSLMGEWYGDASANDMCTQHYALNSSERPGRKAKARWRFVHKTFVEVGLCDCRGKWKMQAGGPRHMECTVCQE